MDAEEAKRLNRIKALEIAAQDETLTASEIVAAARKFADFLNDVTTDTERGDAAR